MTLIEFRPQCASDSINVTIINMTRLRISAATAHIKKHGALLVFPVQNVSAPPSLWFEFFPKSEMVWDWNEDADHRVSDLWQLMKELSVTREVVYSKWFRGRATFFSLELFAAMLRVCEPWQYPRHNLSHEGRRLFEVLENNSPLSTRLLKEATDLQGKTNEAAYSRAMKQLFTQLLIVGFGEVEDGAFPSAAVGATELIFDDLWRKAADMSIGSACKTIDRFMPAGTPFRRFFERTQKKDSTP
jgi:hypothetical protein